MMVDGYLPAGIDVSQWQDRLDWHLAHDLGLVFAFVRLGDGLRHVEPLFDTHWQGARTAGLLSGVYQLFRPSQDPLYQADLLLERMGPLGPGDLPPALTLEETDGQKPEQLISRALAWMRRVEEKTGRRPLLHTRSDFWRALSNPAGLASYALWLSSNHPDPLPPPAWSRWTFCRYTSQGDFPGLDGNVDLNWFNGTLAELRTLAGLPGGDGLPGGARTHS